MCSDFTLFSWRPIFFYSWTLTGKDKSEMSLPWINLRSSPVYIYVAASQQTNLSDRRECTTAVRELSFLWPSGHSFDRPSPSVCFAVWKNRHMRTVTNYFIVNLSFADVLVTIICLPASLVVDITETWFFGKTLCKIVPYLQVCDHSETQSFTRPAGDWLIHACYWPQLLRQYSINMKLRE